MLKEFLIAQQNLSEEIKKGNFKTQKEEATFHEQEMEKIAKQFEKIYTLPLSQSQGGAGGEGGNTLGGGPRWSICTP
jgi:hypothetical protein